MNLEQFSELAKSFGTEGMFVALLVLVAIYLAKFGGLIKNGNVARIVNVVLSVVFGGYQFGEEAGAFVSAISMIASALLYSLIEWLLSQVKQLRKP